MAPATTITVTAKGDFGYHPKHGPIVKGQKYEINELDYADQLFNPPTPDYKPIWEREAEEAAKALEVASPESRVPVHEPKGGKK